MSSSNLINLMILIWNLPLNFHVAFCNWLDKFLPPTERPREGRERERGESDRENEVTEK